MTISQNARVAGFTFLAYIAAGLIGMAGLTSDARVGVVLALINCFSALVLGVTLYAITRSQDHEIAMLGMTCRVAEGVLGGIFLPVRLALSRATAAGAADVDFASRIAPILLGARSLNTLLGATFFAAGSTLFCWLLLRGRLIPTPLAWLGVVASILLLVALPLQLAGSISGSVATFAWLPMAAFEIPVGFWLLIKGVRP